MKKKLIIAFYLLFLNILIVNSQINIEFIDSIQIYQQAVKLKYDKENEVHVIDNKTFNINYYMNMFDAINIKKTNYVYDYYYFDNFLDGKPYIYIKTKEFDLSKYIVNQIMNNGMNADKQIIHNNIYSFLNDSNNRAYYNIIPKDTERGYIQYLFFREFGEQFALKWHANYHKKFVITSKQIFYDIVQEYINDTIMYSCDTIELKNILIENYLPTIIFSKNDCIIKWIEIETHNGIFERTYKIKRSYPYNIDIIENKELTRFYSLFLY